MEKVPSKQEIAVALRVFAHYLGINVDTELDLLPIAEEVFYDLPEDWEIGIGEDEHENIPYFYNMKTHESGWTHPKEEMCFRKVKQARHDREFANLAKRISSSEEKNSAESLKLVDIEDLVDDNAPGPTWSIDVTRGSPCISSQPKARAAPKHRTNESKHANPHFKTSDATAPPTHAARQTNSSVPPFLLEDPYASVQAREAWQILHEKTSVLNDFQSAVAQYLRDWGCTRAAYLEQLQPGEVEELALLLTTLPSRRLKALLSPTPATAPPPAPAGISAVKQQGGPNRKDRDAACAKAMRDLRAAWERDGTITF